MFDTLFAKSPSIIYKPGGVVGGLVVTTWAQVQEFIALREGAVIVYVDDSIVSPALVPGATGVTDCQGRVEFRPHIVDSTNFVVLQIEPGATLRDIYQITGMEIRCNPQNATPSLDFTSTSGGNLYIREFGLLSNAATATQPALVVPNGKFTIINMEEGSFGLNVAVPFASIQAGGTLEVFAVDGSFMSPGIVSGAGNFILSYDTTSETVFGPPGIPPMPGLAGTYQAQLLDPNAVIYKPGLPASFGRNFATWAEVKSFIALTNGTAIVYVDDSIVSPALVPGATGVTDCQGRVEFRPHIIDSLSYSVLQVEDGATLHNVYAITDVEIRCNSQSATPSLSFSGTPTGGTLILQQFGALTMAAAATQPGIRVAAGTTLLVQSISSGVIAKATFIDFTVPLFDVPLTASLSMFEFEGSLLFNNFASGAGNVSIGFDNTTASFFSPTPGVPPTLPGITGAYSTFDESLLLGDVTGKTLTSLVVAWRNKPLDPATMAAPNVNDVPHWDGAKWAAGPVPASSILSEQTIAASGVFVPTTVDVLVFVDTTGGPVNLTLPAPTAGVATRYTFKDSKQNFNVNALTLVPPGAVLIEGANANFPINAQGAHVTVISDGVNYFV